MISDLYIVSYNKDFPWLKNCLRSISERCKGFRRVNIVIPMKDLAAICGWGLTRELVIGFAEPNIKGDSIQQCLKLHADTYTDADFIVFIDSDVYFTSEFTPDYMMKSGKPLIYMTEYDKIQAHWQLGTEYIFKRKIRYEYMRRFPLGYPRWLLRGLRDHIAKEHGTDLWTLYTERRCPHPLSEFNLLGALAHLYYDNKFTFIDTSEQPPPEPVAVQFWSHGGAGHPNNSQLMLKHGLTL